MYPLRIPVDLDLTMLCHESFAPLCHTRLLALIGWERPETRDVYTKQDVGARPNSPNAPAEDWKACIGLDAFATAQTNQIDR
jgi:hypothetical protein